MTRLFSSSSHSTLSTNAPRIGFIGLGNMGLPMSLNLAKHSHNVIAFDDNSNNNNKAMDIAEEAGIHRATSVEDVGASQCSVIFTMLPGCQAVDHVTSALLESVPSSSNNDTSVVFVDCSTVRVNKMETKGRGFNSYYGNYCK